MKIGYLMVNDVLWKPLIRRQVLELLKDVNRVNENIEINLLVAYPWYLHLTHHFRIRKMILELEPHPIRVHLLPLPIPAPVPYLFPKYVRGKGWRPRNSLNGFSMPFLNILLFPVLLKFYIIDNIRLFHGRSYPASCVLKFFKFFVPGAKYIFDPRSDFPEENLAQSVKKMKVREFDFWKKQEARILGTADATVCISGYYREHYNQNCRAFKNYIIPNNVNTSVFRFNSEARQSLREREAVDSKTVYSYVGTMYPGSWHRPDVYARFIIGLRNCQTPSVVLFLVPEDSREFLVRELEEAGIRPDEYLIRHPAYHEVPDYLSASDCGLFFLANEKIALSVKVVEYHAIGLPVLVNANAISAAILVENHSTGLIVNLGLGDRDTQSSDFKTLALQDALRSFNRESIIKVANDQFSNHRVARQYASLYADLYQ